MATSTLPHLLQTLGFGLITLVTIWLVHAIARMLYNIFLHPLRTYPGPKLWAATAIPGALAQVQGTEIYKVLDLHEKYGPVVRTSPNELSYANAAVWKDAFAHRQGGHAEFGKSERTHVLPPNGVDGILFANRKNHSRFRRAFAASFSDRGMQNQQPLIRGYVDLFIQGLARKSGKEPQDMTAWFNWATFDIIGALTFGESFGCLENQRMHPWIEAIFGNVKGVSIMGALKRTGFGWIIPYIIPKRVAALRLSNAQFSADRMKSRLAKGTNQGDFMDSVMEKHVGTQPGSLGLTFDELTSNASHLVLAGR
jgi:cytochrome P450